MSFDFISCNIFSSEFLHDLYPNLTLYGNVNTKMLYSINNSGYAAHP